MTHVMEGDLMRWLDGETAPDEAGVLAAHVEACAACRVVLEEMRRHDAAWRRAVLTLDDPRHVAPAWRRFAWAATVLVTLGVGVGVRPVRAWIVTQGRTLWATVAGARQEAGPAGPVAGQPVSRVQFVPVAGPFVVTLAGLQSAGELVIEVADANTAAAWIAGAGADADLIVLPDGLRVGNRSEATATYHVRVPAGLATVEVRIGETVRYVLVPARVALGRSSPAGSLQDQEDQP